MDDSVSRQAAIKTLHDEILKRRLHGDVNDGRLDEFDTESILRRLPSAEPERQRGAWIEYIPEHGKCPFCGNQVDLLNGKANNFCGECGADMKGGQE